MAVIVDIVVTMAATDEASVAQVRDDCKHRDIRLARALFSLSSDAASKCEME